MKPNTPLLLLLSSAFAAATLNIQGFIGMMPLIQLDFGISAAEAGLYTSFYFASATVVAVFAGRRVDTLGTGSSLTLAVSVVGVMMLLHAISPAYPIILLLAFVTGIGFSLITPSVSKGIQEHIEPSQRASSMGIAHGFGGVGALIGTAVMPSVAELTGWRGVLTVGAVCALLTALLIRVFWARVSAASATPAVKPERASMLSDMRHLLSNRRLMVLGLVGLVFGFAISSATAHSALFLTRDLGYSPSFAGLALSILYVGSIAGQPGWGIINDRVFGGRRRRGLLLLGFLIAGLTLAFGLVLSPDGALSPEAGVPVPLLLTMMFLLGFTIFGMPPLYFTAIGEITAPEYTGVATGLGLVFTRTGVVVAAPLFGLLYDRTGSYMYSWISLSLVVTALTLSVVLLSRRYPMEHAAPQARASEAVT